MSLSCPKCRSYILAYIHRELTADARQRVDEHLNTCAACYAVYRAERDLSRDLERVRYVGTPNDANLNQIWSAIQSEISPLTLDAKPSFSLNSVLQFERHYSIVVLLLVFTLLIPALFRPSGNGIVLPHQPTPTLMQQISQTLDVNIVAALPSATYEIAKNNERFPLISSQPVLLTSNYAPTPGATDAP